MKNQLLLFFLFSSILLLSTCGVKKHQSSSGPITHEIWDSLLQQYVTETGVVNYEGFIADSVKFNQYLALLGNHHPNDKTGAERND